MRYAGVAACPNGCLLRGSQSVCLVPELDGHIWRGRERDGGMGRGGQLRALPSAELPGHTDSWLTWHKATVLQWSESPWTWAKPGNHTGPLTVHSPPMFLVLGTLSEKCPWVLNFKGDCLWLARQCLPKVCLYLLIGLKMRVVMSLGPSALVIPEAQSMSESSWAGLACQRVTPSLYLWLSSNLMHRNSDVWLLKLKPIRQYLLAAFMHGNV